MSLLLQLCKCHNISTTNIKKSKQRCTVLAKLYDKHVGVHFLEWPREVTQRWSYQPQLLHCDSLLDAVLLQHISVITTHRQVHYWPMTTGTLTSIHSLNTRSHYAFGSCIFPTHIPFPISEKKISIYLNLSLSANWLLDKNNTGNNPHTENDWN